MSDLFTHPWMSGLFGDPEIGALLSPDAQLRHMLEFEATFSRALGHVGRVPAPVAQRAAAHITTAALDVDALREGVAVDGLVIPALVRQLKAGCAEELHSAIHSGLTSQDVIDTVFILSVRDILPILSARIQTITDSLLALSQAQGHHPLMARTRMQAALPITVSHRLTNWKQPLHDHLTRLKQLTPRLLHLQLGGAVGDRAALGEHGAEIAGFMARHFDLANPGTCWHSRRDGVAEFASWLSLVAGSLGKIGSDIALMAQQGVDDITLSGGGGSSAMPHKCNPVRAELLETLARFNATQLAGLHHALNHEQERSGTAWMLEWMILPQMILATGRATTACAQLLGQIRHIGTPQ